MATSGKSVEGLEAEAAAWAAKLDAAPDQTPPGLDAWVAQDPRHAGALLRAQATLALFEPEPRVEHAPARPTHERRLAIIGGGAAALAAGLALAFLPGSPSQSFEARIGEIRSVALRDGSSVAIDAKSKIDIAFDAKGRDVYLRTGKALFHAAHNAQRPFRVIVGDIVVTDIGTTFQVTRDGPTGAVEVLVTQGSVRVDSPSGRLDLKQGERARFAVAASSPLRPELTRVSPSNVERALAWQDGRLELNGESLDTAIAEINRHSVVQLRVGDAALGKEGLYGSFRMDDAASFANVAAASLGTEAHPTGDGITIGSEKK